MAEKQNSISTATKATPPITAPSRPTITLPPRSSVDFLYTGGFSPGPMTLLSSFFPDNYPDSDSRSFSQLLAGAMASPVARPAFFTDASLPNNNNSSSFSKQDGSGSNTNLGFKQSRPMNLVVAHSPMFTVPPGLSPSGLLNSPGFFSPPQSPFGMSHQQALAQVTAQAALAAQSQMHMQAHYQPVTLTDSSELMKDSSSFPPVEASQQQTQIAAQAAQQTKVTAQAAQQTQVTAQAARPAQSRMHLQVHYQPVTLTASSELMKDSSSFPPVEASQQQQTLPSTSAPQSSMVEPSEPSHSDRKQQPLAVDKPSDDGYNWRKYGQKPIKGSEYPRSYYKCTHLNCPVKKQVERSSDGQITEIIYKGHHNHELPQPNKRAKDNNDQNGIMNSQARPEPSSQNEGGNINKLSETISSHSLSGRDQESTQVDPTEPPAGSSDSEEAGDGATRAERSVDEPNPKRRQIDVGTSEVAVPHRTVTDAKIIVQTRSEVDLLDDGYRWRKYGQKVVKGNPHPRSYYKCTSTGCNVRKHVERAAADPKAVITTYEGKHNHDVPAARHSSHNAANSNALQLKPQKLVANKHSMIEGMDLGNSDQRPVLLRLKEEEIAV
ncbi:probable WRKY transcription factor 3 [Euphorbia lathyris]|uniref:probable WRKY transcription factor 3 n=1 Tax=Euphorbia lathyris TaxID=212925 RepID=UPI0033141044